MVRQGEPFAESTKVFPIGAIIRKPDGTLGSTAEDKMFKISKTCSFQVFEYSDPDKHILKKVTQLEVEPVSEILILLKNNSYEGVIDLLTPPEKNIFTIKC